MNFDFIKNAAEYLGKHASDIFDILTGLGNPALYTATKGAESIGAEVASATGIPISTPSTTAQTAEQLAIPTPIEDLMKEFAKGFVLDTSQANEQANLLTNDIEKVFGKIPGIDIGEAIAGNLEMILIAQMSGALEELMPSAAFIMAPILDKVIYLLGKRYQQQAEYIGNWISQQNILPLAQSINLMWRNEMSEDDVLADFRKEGYSFDTAKKFISSMQQLTPAAQIIQLYFRGFIKSVPEYTARMGTHGIGADVAMELLDTSMQLLPLQEIINLWRRGYTTYYNQDIWNEAKAQGWSSEAIDMLKKGSYQLPSIFNVQDFAVRKVDDPATVEKYQLDYGINEEYFKSAEAVGYDRATAQQFYRLYWNIPPFFQVASWFKSGIMAENTFREILLYSRYTPYWVDRMVESLKPRLKPADIKSLYEYQMIPYDQISPMLQSTGMDLKLADQYALLWQASVKLKNTDAKATVKKETIGLVETAFKDKVIDILTAKKYLEDIGYTSDEIDLYTKIWQFQITSTEIKQDFSTIKENMLSGIITYEDAVGQIQKIDLTVQQYNLYYAELTRAIKKKPAIPSLADLKAFLKKGAIGIKEAIDLMRLHGYADKYIPMFLIDWGASSSDLKTAQNYLSQ